jgi:uncharacterized protein YbaR (Trm112 family)
MIDSKLLDILVCPESKQSLKLAEDELLGRINQAISDKKVSNKSGNLVSEKVESALITEDGKTAYPVRSDIPVMLIDEAIALSQVEQ